MRCTLSFVSVFLVVSYFNLLFVFYSSVVIYVLFIFRDAQNIVDKLNSNPNSQAIWGPV